MAMHSSSFHCPLQLIPSYPGAGIKLMMAFKVQWLCLAALMALWQCGVVLASPKPPHILPPRNPAAPEQLSTAQQPRSVLVAGGGLAGLTAALQLAERGYNVTLVERSQVLGGRLMTRPLAVQHATLASLTDRQFQVEHGFHVVFYNYWNMRHVLEKQLDISLQDHFDIYRRVYFHFKEPYQSETIASLGPFPWNVLRISLVSRNVNVWGAISSSLMLPDLLFYNHEYVQRSYANITFLQYCRDHRVHPGFFHVLLRTALSVTLNKLETISAAEVLTFIHIYFISHPEAYHRFVPKASHSETIIDPWARRLEELGVRILKETHVQSLQFDSTQSSVVSATLVSEPAHVDLDDGDEVYLERRATGYRHAFDHYVLATNLPNIHYILNQSTVLLPERVQTYNGQLRVLPQTLRDRGLDAIRNQVRPLPVAPAYRVMRVWYGEALNLLLRPDAWSIEATPDEEEDVRPKILETPDSLPIHLMILYHRLERESQEWARNNGSIIEFHLYDVPEYLLPFHDPREVYAKIKDEAVKVLPALEHAEPVGFTMGRFHNFPQFAAGLVRPTHALAQEAGVENLQFAGDWLSTPNQPTALMERAIVTGKQAANEILYRDQVREAEIIAMTNHGPGLF